MNDLQKIINKYILEYESQCAFVQQAYKQGWCSYEEALKALSSITQDHKQDLEKEFQYKY